MLQSRIQEVCVQDSCPGFVCRDPSPRIRIGSKDPHKCVSRIESQVCVQDRRIQDRRIEGSHFLGRRKIVTFLSFCSVDTA